ncbi:MAG: hypothetical protein A2494_01810 [Candidatus Lloydbacteria bacterium RIFOXYC12_FULL_46_25]|uniref:DUF1189 domain-containing protein n=1 Tax=Candidatus Lloydbacteria bacterium RIFOXYC12_FULL_46_25 TaxID=1798670 RepID=A0A1G2E036_9BACT|nr:MAG: hypothetical protein A2494_01810 [Candidatus Lloydbacteria bacterium RIFOXYC12_FULL_46_25]
MKQLFSYIKESVYSPEYYRQLLSRPFSYSWKYYSALAMLLAVFLTIVSSVPLVPIVNRATHEFPQKFFAYYPDELELHVQNGVVTTNVAEPYFLPLPEMLKSEIADENVAVDHLVVIDTKTPISLEAFRAYGAIMWIGSTAIASYDDQKGITIKPMTKDANFVVSETVLRSIESRMSPYYVFISPVMVLAIFFGLMIALGINFIYLVFGAVFIMLFGRFALKQKWGYGTSYRIGLHAITLSLLADALFSVVGVNIVSIPFLQTALILAVVYVNYKDMKSSEEGEASSPEVVAP